MKAPKINRKSKGKSIKGYLVGGDITENNGIYDPTTGQDAAKQRKYKTGLLPTIGDLGKELAYTASVGNITPEMLGGMQTTTGVDAEQTGAIYNAGVKNIGGAVLNYYVPGAGTLVNKGQDAWQKTLPNEDLNDATKSNVSKIDSAGQVIGSLGTVLSGLGKGKTSNTAMPMAEQDSVNVPTATTQDITSLNTTTPSPNVPVNTGMTPEQTNIYNTLPEDQKDAWLKKNIGMKKGGLIKGAGTGLSDSIKANLDEGGFVAIAKKKEQAEAIRKKYLGSKGKIASLRGGDTPVKVSNGETYFTEDEKDLIISKGGEKELNALAPEAKVKAKNNYVIGGGILTTEEEKAKLQEEANKRAGLADYTKSKADVIAEGENPLSERDANWEASQRVNQAQIQKDLTDASYKEKIAGTPTASATINPATGLPYETPKKGAWWEKSANIGSGIEKAFSIGQIGLGLKSLNDLGDRPVDTTSIPKDYLATIDRAKKDASFGMSPAERAIAERNDILNERNKFASVAGSGLDASSQLGWKKAIGRDTMDSNNNRSVLSDKLQTEKQRYYDTLIGGKTSKTMGLSRDLFNDKLNAFNVDQTAGAGLLYEGGKNLKDSFRYDREVAKGLKRELGYDTTSDENVKAGYDSLTPAMKVMYEDQYKKLPEADKSKYKSVVEYWGKQNKYIA